MHVKYLSSGLQSAERESNPPVVMTLGYFDGVHEGHQRVIATAAEAANKRGVETALLTFHPHPRLVLAKEKTGDSYPEITPLPMKLEEIARLDIDYVYVVTFDKQLASLSPQAFVDQYLLPLNTVHAVAGFDFSYGQFGKGSMSTLPEHSRGLFECTKVHKWEKTGEKVSSTRIREVIRSGEVESAQELLRRPHKIRGKVVKGDQRGRTIGFPTANIELEENFVLPKAGVYCVIAHLEGEEYPAVCNIGYRPTFYEEQTDVNIEAYLLDFNGDIYDAQVDIAWLKRLRSEQKFSSLDELKAQLHKDEQMAREFFG